MKRVNQFKTPDRMRHDLAARMAQFTSRTACPGGVPVVVYPVAAALLVGFCAPSAAGQSEAATSSAPTSPLPGYTLVWSDEFEGETLDPSKWEYRTDSKHLSTQKPENVAVKDGLLHLTLRKEAAGGKQYTGAGIVSKAAFRHGYYEARVKVPAAAGWHTAFWLMKHDGSGTTDSHLALQGVDVFEHNSIDPHSYQVCVRKYNPEPPEVYGFGTVTSPDLAAGFHLLGCEFSQEEVRFFLDGQPVRRVEVTGFEHGDQNIWVTSIASHMGGTQKVDDNKLPAVVLCDHVRFFQRSPSGESSP
jgi:beta-glucanase (GH16 family)